MKLKLFMALVFKHHTMKTDGKLEVYVYNSYSGHPMDVSAILHAPAALLPEKESPVPFV
jgi:hypothetical protein